MKRTLSALILSVAVATPAFAEGGFYIGGTLGRASTQNFGAVALTNTSASVYGGLVGYQFDQNLGIEAGFTGAGKFSNATMSGKGDVFTASVIGTLPVSDSFSIYGKLGIGSSKTKISDTTLKYQGVSRTAVAYGLGVQYNATPQVGLRFGWDRFGSAIQTVATGAKTNFNSNVFSAGIVYLF